MTIDSTATPEGSVTGPETDTDTVEPDTGGDSSDDDAQPSQADDDLSDLSPDDYQRAAELLAQEAEHAQQPGSEDTEPVSAREQRYRQRAQAAEADRNRLTELVEDMRNREIQRLVSDRLADPADLFRDGITVEDLLDEHGHVDPAHLAAAVDRLLAAHPHWAAPRARYRGPFLSGASQSKLVDTPAGRWRSAFEPKDD